MKSFITLLILFLTVSSVVHAQETSGGKLSGLVFGDYFYKSGGDAQLFGSPSQYSQPMAKNFQAFQLRRMYLIYDHTISQKFSAQFLLEGNDKALDNGGRHGVFVKTAFLEWKEIFLGSNLAIGLVPTPTWSWGVAEKIWNYRSLEKTIADFRGFGGASDLGVALRGKIDGGGMLSYVAMIGNGAGQKPETDRYKKYYGELNFKPLKELTVEGYADYEPAANDKNVTTLKGVVAYQIPQVTLGVELAQQMRRKDYINGADRQPLGISAYMWAPIPGVERLNAVARYDFFNPDTKISNAGFNEQFFLIGLDYMPENNVHIMPNFWLNSFSDKSTAGLVKDSDTVFRVTFFYVYK
ncbi:MAG: hypothetical protein HY276_11705 [Ignavibacteriales bacterium]|nr:hypothetical protein [Ignavibacteriales bacterium]